MGPIENNKIIANSPNNTPIAMADTFNQPSSPKANEFSQALERAGEGKSNNQNDISAQSISNSAPTLVIEAVSPVTVEQLSPIEENLITQATTTPDSKKLPSEIPTLDIIKPLVKEIDFTPAQFVKNIAPLPIIPQVIESITQIQIDHISFQDTGFSEAQAILQNSTLLASVNLPKEHEASLQFSDTALDDELLLAEVIGRSELNTGKDLSEESKNLDHKLLMSKTEIAQSEESVDSSFWSEDIITKISNSKIFNFEQTDLEITDEPLEIEGIDDSKTLSSQMTIALAPHVIPVATTSHANTNFMEFDDFGLMDNEANEQLITEDLVAQNGSQQQEQQSTDDINPEIKANLPNSTIQNNIQPVVIAANSNTIEVLPQDFGIASEESAPISNNSPLKTLEIASLPNDLNPKNINEEADLLNNNTQKTFANSILSGANLQPQEIKESVILDNIGEDIEVSTSDKLHPEKPILSPFNEKILNATYGSQSTQNLKNEAILPKQVADQVIMQIQKNQIDSKNHQISFFLEPESLGKIDIVFKTSNGNTSIEILSEKFTTFDLLKTISRDIETIVSPKFDDSKTMLHFGLKQEGGNPQFSWGQQKNDSKNNNFVVDMTQALENPSLVNNTSTGGVNMLC